MNGPIHEFLTQDHRRLDELLHRASAEPDHIDHAVYKEFRAGLLKHIGLEEKILLPAIRKLRRGEPLPIEDRIRLDHGALAALLVPPPSLVVISAIHAILESHNTVEEASGGLYDVCETLAGDNAVSLLEQMKAAPDVPVAPHVEDPKVFEATRRALARAGYNLDNWIGKNLQRDA